MKNKGFTLVEILAVIVILGFIALIALPDVIKNTKNAKEDLYKTQIDLIKSSTNSYVTYMIAHPDKVVDNSDFWSKVAQHEADEIKITLATLQKAGAVEIDVENPLCDGEAKFFIPNSTSISIVFDGKDFTYDVCDSSVDNNHKGCTDDAKKELRKSCKTSNIN